WAMAWAGAFGLVFIEFGGMQDFEDRLVSIGSFANSNVVAIFLLTIIPFWTFIVVRKKSGWLPRVVFTGAILASLSLILKTGSRSGLLSILLLALMAFFSASLANKAKL